MADVLFGAFLLALCFYVGRTWLRWFRAEPRLVSPKWCSGVTTIGFSACTVSLVTILLLMLYATVSSSLTPYHPISALAYRTIFVTSLLAIVAGIVGKGPLETPTFVCASLFSLAAYSRCESELSQMSEFDDLTKRIQQDSTLQLPVNSLDDSVPPKNHAARVTAFTIAIARQMGLLKEEINVIARGAYLHDVGKMAIDHAILLKPGTLTPEETARMREHCLLGYKMVQKFPHLAGADEIVYSHHERYDGTGYPRGLKGEQIPLGARIVAVANTLDSITTNLPYRAAQSLEAARAEIQRWSGHQFDPEIVEVFLQMPDKIWSELMQSLHRQPPA